MSKSGTIIIVDDNKGVLTAVQILLKNYFSKVVTLSSPVTLTTAIREETPEVVLLDMNFTSGINTGNEESTTGASCRTFYCLCGY